MNGDELCDLLKSVAGAAKDVELARAIGFKGSARVSQLRSAKKAIKPDYAAKLVGKVATNQTRAALEGSIKPIVEFFPIARSQVRVGGRHIPFDSKCKAGRELVSRLHSARGIYAFYNSQAEIIYVGRTDRQTLFDRLVQSYNRRFPKARLFRVRHPWGLYRSTNKNELRKIRREVFTLRDVASYFSAYSVSDPLIGKLEALLIRMAPNDLINIKLQESELKAFPPPAL
jgi:hypothetical protein